MTESSLRKQVGDVAGHYHPWPVVIPDPRDVKSIVTFAVVLQVTQRHLRMSQDHLERTTNLRKRHIEDFRSFGGTATSNRRGYQNRFYIVEKTSISRTFDSMLKKSSAFIKECEIVHDLLSNQVYNAGIAPSLDMSFKQEVYCISEGLTAYWGTFMTNNFLEKQMTKQVLQTVSRLDDNTTAMLLFTRLKQVFMSLMARLGLLTPFGVPDVIRFGKTLKFGQRRPRDRVLGHNHVYEFENRSRLIFIFMHFERYLRMHNFDLDDLAQWYFRYVRATTYNQNARHTIFNEAAPGIRSIIGVEHQTLEWLRRLWRQQDMLPKARLRRQQDMLLKARLRPQMLSKEGVHIGHSMVMDEHCADMSPRQQDDQRASPFLPISAEYLHDPVTYHGRLDEIETCIVELCSQYVTLETPETKTQKRQVIVVNNGPSLSSPKHSDLATSPVVTDIIIATFRITAAIMKAFTYLQDNDFCGKEFNIVVLDPSISCTLRIVPINEELLIYLAGIVEDAMSLIEGLACEAIDLKRRLDNWALTATHILEYLGLGSQDCQSLESGCSLFLCLMNVLSFGLMSYAGSHISAFHKKILRAVDGALLDSNVFCFNLSSGSHIYLQRYGLACLEPYIGAPVWAFPAASANSPETLASMKIMTSLKSFSDLWGPVQIIYQDSRSKLISAIFLDKGLLLSIVPPSETQGQHDNYESGNGVIHCHWYSLDGELPQRYPFEDTAMLLIGGDDSRQNQRPEYDLQVNTACNRQGLGPVLKMTSWPQSIGVREKTYETEAVDYTAGFSLHARVEVKGQVKSRPGQTVKGLLRMKWANADSNDNLMPPELGDLNLRFCVEISACTGNAQRIELWEVFKIKNVRDWILKNIYDLEGDDLPGSSPTELFLKAVDDGPDTFKLLWERRMFRRNAIKIIGTVLQFLDNTGPQDKAMYGPVPRLGQEKVIAAWFPGIKPDGHLISQKEHKWTEMLTNSAKEAALIVLSKTCLQSSHPEGTRCHEQNGRRTVLRTALVFSNPERRDWVKERRPKQSYATTMPSSSARDESSIRSLMAKLKLSDSRTGRSRMLDNDARSVTESRYASAAVSGLYIPISASRHYTASAHRNTKAGQRTAEHHPDSWIKAIVGSRIHGYTTLHLPGLVVPRRGRGRMFLQLHDGNKIEAIGDQLRGDRESYWEFMNYDEQKNDKDRVLYVCVA